jgi:acetoin:2,6-dichlorophenolindophenol oxidoreductase subunit alpha
MGSGAEHHLADYRTVLLIRRVEEQIADLFAESRIGGTCHLCIGQEASAVGVCNALKPGDEVVSCHRGHGHLLAMGGDPARVLGELMGKEIGYCRGRGGSQHMSAPEIGFLGTNGITGGGIPIATGAALSAKTLGKGSVVVCFFGDGATSQGAFHEALNMASLWKLPVLFVCENNGYAMSTPIARTVAGGDLCARASAYAMRTMRADGMDVGVTKVAAEDLVNYVRSGNGPAFLELLTYRFCGHSKSDRLVYRTRDEEADWAKRDPVVTLRQSLDDAGLSDEADKVEADVAEAMTDAERRCDESPDADPATALEGVMAHG